MAKLNEGTRISLSLEKLNVWTDNPRFDQRYSESDSITMLFITVTEKKMFDLVRDIIDYGLQINEAIIVVQNDSLYDVYDGNRRIAAIKSALNPQLVNDVSIRNNLINLIKDVDLSQLPDTIEVVQTTEQVAKELILRKHGPQDSGSSLQNWSTWSRDKFLFEQMKTTPQNKFAYSAIKDLGFNTYIEFKKNYNIEYTNLNRILSTEEVQNYFNDLKTTDFENYKILLGKYIIKSLKVVDNLGKSFSRHFNDSNTIISLLESFKEDVQMFEQPATIVTTSDITPKLMYEEIKSIIDRPGTTRKYSKLNTSLLYEQYKSLNINIGVNINTVFDEMKRITPNNLKNYPISFISLMRISIDTAVTDFVQAKSIPTSGSTNLAKLIKLSFDNLDDSDYINVTNHNRSVIKKFISKRLFIVEENKVKSGDYLTDLHEFIHKSCTIEDLLSYRTNFNDCVIPFIIALSNHIEKIRRET